MLRCALCGITSTSQVNHEQHLRGKRHLKNARRAGVAGAAAPGPTTRPARAGKAKNAADRTQASGGDARLMDSKALVVESDMLPRERAVLKQLCYYFSARNLPTDVYLQKMMTPGGWAAADGLLTFRKLAKWRTNNVEITSAVARDPFQRLEAKLGDTDGRLWLRRSPFHLVPGARVRVEPRIFNRNDGILGVFLRRQGPRRDSRVLCIDMGFSRAFCHELNARVEVNTPYGLGLMSLPDGARVSTRLGQIMTIKLSWGAKAYVPWGRVSCHIPPKNARKTLNPIRAKIRTARLQGPVLSRYQAARRAYQNRDFDIAARAFTQAMRAHEANRGTAPECGDYRLLLGRARTHIMARNAAKARADLERVLDYKLAPDSAAHRAHADLATAFDILGDKMAARRSLSRAMAAAQRAKDLEAMARYRVRVSDADAAATRARLIARFEARDDEEKKNKAAASTSKLPASPQARTPRQLSPSRSDFFFRAYSRVGGAGESKVEFRDPVKHARAHGLQAVVATDVLTLGTAPPPSPSKNGRSFRECSPGETPIFGVEIPTFCTHGRGLERVAIVGYLHPAAVARSQGGAGLATLLHEVKVQRHARATAVVQKLEREMKLKVELRAWSSVLDVADALVEAGQARDEADAVRRFLGQRFGRAYVAGPAGGELSGPDAVRLVRCAGGIAALARPWEVRPPLEIDPDDCAQYNRAFGSPARRGPLGPTLDSVVDYLEIDILPRLKKAGLEAMQTSHADKAIDAAMKSLADRMGLIALGGSHTGHAVVSTRQEHLPTSSLPWLAPPLALAHIRRVFEANLGRGWATLQPVQRPVCLRDACDICAEEAAARARAQATRSKPSTPPSQALVPYSPALPWLHAQERTVRVCGRDVRLRQVQRGNGNDIKKAAPAGTGAILWNASVALARFLETRHGASSLRDKTVVEIGAGLGLPSISAALLGARVTATDGDDAVIPTLRENIQNNVREAATHTPIVKQYTWGSAAAAAVRTAGEATSGFDYVIAADVVYEKKAFRPLLAALRALSNENTQIIISYRIRYEEQRSFFSVAQRHFVVQYVSKAQIDSEFSSHIEIALLQLRPPVT